MAAREATRTPTQAAAAAWHALHATDVLRRLDASEHGLSDAEALRRLARFGPNALAPATPPSAWSIVLGQFRSVLVLLLLVAVGLALVAGDAIEAVAIAVVLLINVTIGAATELRARRAMTALLALQPVRATVVRDGRAREIEASALVPGDLIVVEAGRRVPADARLLAATGLRVDEASLTGESVPADKHADGALAPAAPLAERETMLYMSTTVVAGSGRGVVTATGAATEVGRIGALAAAVTPEPTPLERRLDALGRRLAVAAIAVAAVIALLAVVRGLPATAVLQTGIAVAIAAVPEGLPAVVTIATAVGVWRMARRRALVRRLPAVETLGSTTVICTDKTGTLTAGEQTVTTLVLDDGREVRITGTGYAPEGELLEGGAPIPRDDRLVALALRIAVLANRSDVAGGPRGWTVRGDPTEAALLVAARKWGVTREAELEAWPQVGELPFDSARMLMASYHRAPDGRVVAFVKGAPGRVLAASDHVECADGTVTLDERAREALLAANRELAGRGLRVLALAHGPAPASESTPLRGLTFVGLVGLADPPAPGVEETIRRFREAGIRTVMLTGDQRLTAEAVARELSLLLPGGTSVDGAELEGMSDEALDARVGTAVVFSRMSPEAKLRVIAALQRRGEIVAMLGDGVNDAAGLKRADIGVAMGRRGTDAAREAAEIVLQDDRLQTVAAAVEEGRVIFGNIRKFVFYLFSCNVGELLVLVAAGLAGLPQPLLPLQLLWLNLLTDTLPALALALEPADPDVMRQPPRSPRAAILSRRMTWSMLLHATLIGGSALAALAWGLNRSGPDERRAMTLCFMTLAVAQLLHLGNARSVRPVLAPARALANRFALAAVVITLALQALAVGYAPLAGILRLRPLSAEDWVVILLLGVVPAVVGQTLKIWRRPSASLEDAGHSPPRLRSGA